MISLEERIYSKAFEDGVNYAIQKIFNEEEDKKKKEYLPYAAGSAAGSAIGFGAGGAMLGLIGSTNSTRERLKYWLSERKRLEKKNLKKEEKRNKNKEKN